MLVRFIIFLAIAAGLGLFAVQNLTPAMALVFLGIQTPTLPLSVWILGAIAAGAVTSLIIRLLFGLSSLGSDPPLQSPRQAAPRRTEGRDRPTAAAGRYESAARAAARSTAEPEDDAAWQDWRGYESPSPRAADPVTPPRSPANASTANASTARNSPPVDDWEQPFNEEWETSNPQDRPRTATNPASRSNSDPARNFEVERSPTQKAQSGSVYSYSYQNPQDTGVGKTENVVDADYRVLVPPYRPLDADAPEPPLTSSAFGNPAATAHSDQSRDETENADDWFDDSSDDFEDPPRQ